MKKVDELTEELKNAILQSEEYLEYKRMEEEISKQPDLKRAVDEFRKQNFLIHYSGEYPDVLSASEELNNRTLDLRTQPGVYRFLASEMKLCRMVSGICNNIVEVMDFNMDFLR